MGWAGPWAMGWAVNGSGLGWNFYETNGLWMGLGFNFEIVRTMKQGESFMLNQASSFYPTQVNKHIHLIIIDASEPGLFYPP